MCGKSWGALLQLVFNLQRNIESAGRVTHVNERLGALDHIEDVIQLRIKRRLGVFFPGTGHLFSRT